MKIVVIGAHGVGKTSLVEEFALRHPTYKIIPEMAREMIAAAGGEVASLYDFELELLWRRLQAERAYSAYADVITDRTAIDSWVYCAYHKVFPRRLLDVLYELALSHTNSFYDLVVYLSVEEFTAPRDAFTGDCAPVDELFRKVLPDLKRVVTLTGSVEERADKLWAHVCMYQPDQTKREVLRCP